MKTCGKVLIWVVVLAAGLVGLWCVTRSAEPGFQGRKLTQWATGYESVGSQLQVSFDQQVEAVLSIGTNSLPHLLKEIQATPPAYTRFACAHLDWHRFDEIAVDRRNAAVMAFGYLGEAASPVIPTLRELVYNDDAGIGLSALWALGNIRTEGVVPVFIEALTNSHFEGKFQVVRCLGRMGHKSRAAVPYLLRLLDGSEEYIQADAAQALGRISLSASEVVPKLISKIENPRSRASAEAAEAVGSFGLAANSAIPALRRLAEGTNQIAFDAARNAKLALVRVQCEMREGAIIRGPRSAKAFALVFTGHEFAEGASTILKELAAHNARASFFLTGGFAAKRESHLLLEQIAAAGHAIGPHSDGHLLYCDWSNPERSLVTYIQFGADITRNRVGLAASGCVSAKGCLVNYFIPPYEHYNREIADWSKNWGWTLINYTPGTRSNADYTGEADTNFVSSQAIFDSILQKEREDPHGLNGFILLFHVGAGPCRADKFHTRFGELLDVLCAKGYQFVRVDELLEPKEAK